MLYETNHRPQPTLFFIARRGSALFKYIFFRADKPRKLRKYFKTICYSAGQNFEKAPKYFKPIIIFVVDDS